MPEMTRQFSLVKKAAKSGGDRYAEVHDRSAMPVIGTLYLNQWFSRDTEDGEPAKIVEITVSTLV